MLLCFFLSLPLDIFATIVTAITPTVFIYRSITVLALSSFSFIFHFWLLLLISSDCHCLSTWSECYFCFYERYADHVMIEHAGLVSVMNPRRRCLHRGGGMVGRVWWWYSRFEPFQKTNDHFIIRSNKNVALLEQKQPSENSEWKAFKHEHSHNW